MLLEATQSQQVRAGQAKLNFFKPKVEVKEVKEEKEEKEERHKRKALILFEDIDIVFEEQGISSKTNL